jgi:hypothetical protein
VTGRNVGYFGRPVRGSKAISSDRHCKNRVWEYGEKNQRLSKGLTTSGQRNGWGIKRDGDPRVSGGRQSRFAEVGMNERPFSCRTSGM